MTRKNDLQGSWLRGIWLLPVFFSIVAVPSIQAQTWSASPTDSNWNNAANWAGGVPNGASDTATFAASSITQISDNMTSITLSGIQFNTGASAYVIENSGTLAFEDVGITDLSGVTQQLENSGTVLFQNSSSAGDLQIMNSFAVTFTDTSTAGQADIINDETLSFAATATAGNSTISNSGSVYFNNGSTAGDSTIVNNGTVSFGDSTNAGTATLTNYATLFFDGNSSAATAVITNNSFLQFQTAATAGNAWINNTSSGDLNFIDTSNAGGATLLNSGVLAFNNSANAGNAEITNDNVLQFESNASAANAQILNKNILIFEGTSTAGAATITTGNGGDTMFNQGAMGGTAQFITDAGGVFDASGLTSGSLTMGSYTQASGGTLRLAVGSGAQDFLTVTGNASLAGSLNLVFDGFSLAQGNSVTLLTAANLSGLFNQWNNPQGERLFPIYDPTQLVLEAVLPTFQIAGLTLNEKAVAGALDNAFEDPNRYSLMANLVNQTHNALPDAFSQIDPSGLTSFYQMGFLAARSQAEVVTGRLGEETPVQPLPPQVRGPQDVLFAADLPASEESAMAQEAAKGADGWDGFLNGYGNFATLISDGNGTGYQLAVGGLTGGADYRLDPYLTTGILLGYDQGNAAPDNGGQVDVNGGQGGLYAGWHDHGFHAEALGEVGFNSYKFQQANYGGTATGTANGEQYSGSLGLGYRFRLNELKVGPFASAQYTYVHVDAFNEAGSNAPLQFPGQGESAFLSDLGIGVDQSWQLNDATLSPGLMVAWQHLYQGNQDSLSADLGNSSEAFTVQGPTTGTDALALGIQVAADFQGGWRAYAGFDGLIGRVNYTGQNLAGGIQSEF